MCLFISEDQKMGKIERDHREFTGSEFPAQGNLFLLEH